MVSYMVKNNNFFVKSATLGVTLKQEGSTNKLAIYIFCQIIEWILFINQSMLKSWTSLKLKNRRPQFLDLPNIGIKLKKLIFFFSHTKQYKRANSTSTPLIVIYKWMNSSEHGTIKDV